MRFDIPVNISVDANNEQQAEKYVIEFLRTSFREFANDYRLIDSELFEFIAKESCNSGCGDNNIREGQCACC